MVFTSILIIAVTNRLAGRVHRSVMIHNLGSYEATMQILQAIGHNVSDRVKKILQTEKSGQLLGFLYFPSGHFSIGNPDAVFSHLTLKIDFTYFYRFSRHCGPPDIGGYVIVGHPM